METVWYCLLAWMLATYVVLDGFDFGVGMVHLFVARNEAERKQVIWSGFGQRVTGCAAELRWGLFRTPVD